MSLDPDTLIDNIVTSLRSCSALVTALGNDANNIIARKLDYSEEVNANIEGETQEQPSGTIMVYWKGTRTGNFGKTDRVKHDFGISIKPFGRAGEMFNLIRDGVCTQPYTMKFKLIQVNNEVDLPENFACIPASVYISQGYGLYDASVISFTLTERGVDN